MIFYTVKSRGMLIAAGAAAFLALLSFLLPRSKPPQTAVLRIVSDAADGRPIDGARVLGLGPTGPLHARTGADGRVSFPRGGQAEMSIRAPGYVGVLVGINLDLADQAVVLRRAGSARFDAVDADGKPVMGLTIRLTQLSDFTTLLPGLEPTKTTDASGTTRWADLAPGATYEWACVSGHPIEPGPGIEMAGRRAVQLVDGGWGLENRGGNPFEAKGTVKIASGGESVVALKVRRTSTATFRLGTGPDASGPATIQVWNLQQVTTPGGNFRDNQAERRVEAAVGAPISIPNLTPGKKCVQATWWDAPGTIAFARFLFDLSAGETKDLGTLAPLPEKRVEVLVRLEGPEDALDPESTVTLAVQGSHREREELAVEDHVIVPLNTPVTLAGIDSEKLVLLCMPSLKFREEAGTFRVEPAPQVELALPAKSRVEIPIRARKLVKMQANFEFPELTKESRFEAVLVPAGGGAVEQVGGVSGKAGEREKRLDAYAPPGEYEIRLAGRDGLTLYAVGSVTVREDGSGAVNLGKLKPGAILRGRAKTKDGKPYTPPLFFAMGEDRSLYWAKPDDEGNFQVTGIPPGATLGMSGFEPGEVEVGIAGSETRVELTALE